MMKEGFHGREPSREGQKRASGILRYIENAILAKDVGESDEESEGEIRAYYASRSTREKADILYEKIMAHVTDKQAYTAQSNKKNAEGNDSFRANPDLMMEIRVLSEDQPTKDLFSKTYAEARVDAKSYRMSDLGKTWKHLNEQIGKLEKKFQQVEQALFLRTIEGKSHISSARSKAERLAGRLLALKTQRENLKAVNLEKVPHTSENTDAAAAFQFETLTKYRDQLKDGFVWMPSRERIHSRIVEQLQNGRWPLLVGESRTGKSFQANAAAIELTGNLPVKVACDVSTSEKHLVEDLAIDPVTGGSYKEYGAFVKAYTGFDDSRQGKPTHSTGRIVRLDEFGRIGDKAYSIIKEMGELKPGYKLANHRVLEGSGAILTTNPAGLRYPNRRPLDAAMRAEVAEISVDYFEQSNSSPEEYEFMIAALLDENGHIPIAEKELAPAYIRHEFADDEKQTLPDGRVVVAEDLLIADSTDGNHGTLWRLANAVRAVHDCFNNGNKPADEIPADALRFDINSDTITSSGEPLTLSSSTLAPDEIANWMQGFKDRLQKQNEAFQVESFSEWIKLKIDIYLKQVDQADRAKVKAIFDHFHLLDAPPNLKGAKPITPKRIGYLSPRVPRPLHVETPILEAVGGEPTEQKGDTRPPELYTTVEVSLEDGSNVRIRKGNQSLRTKVSPELVVNQKTNFRVEDCDYLFAGTLEEGGKPVGSFSSEPDLHKVFSSEEVEKGIIDYSFQNLEKDVEE